MKKLTTKGFTILEVLIAITLLSFMMVGVIQTVNNSQDAKDLILTEDRFFMQAQMAMARIQKDFAHIYSPLYYSRQYNPNTDPYNYGKNREDQIDHNSPYRQHRRFAFVSTEGHPVPIFASEEKNTFEFFTAINRRKSEQDVQSNYAWVRYYLDPVEKIPNSDEYGDFKEDIFNLIRLYSTTDIFSDSAEPKGARPYILLKRVTKLAFQFWDPKTEKFVERLREVKGGENLLRAIKLQISYLDKTNVEVSIERIFRPIWPKFEAEDLSKLYRSKKDEDEDLVEVEDEKK